MAVLAWGPWCLTLYRLGRWHAGPFRTGGHFISSGVPLRTGSLYPGNENDAQAYREVRSARTLASSGLYGERRWRRHHPQLSSHHSIPPIRSWPGPRIAWDCISQRITPYLQQPGHVPLLIGCDCSIVVGTTQALVSTSGKGVHVLYIDAHFDDALPDSEHCQSAASLAVWLLTNASPSGPVQRCNRHRSPSSAGAVPRSRNSQGSGQSPWLKCDASAHKKRRDDTGRNSASEAIVLHLDIDVFEKQEMRAAYFPHLGGLNLSEGKELLALLLRDPRIRIIEVSEYASLRDLDRQWVGNLWICWRKV